MRIHALSDENKAWKDQGVDGNTNLTSDSHRKFEGCISLSQEMMNFGTRAYIQKQCLLFASFNDARRSLMGVAWAARRACGV